MCRGYVEHVLMWTFFIMQVPILIFPIKSILPDVLHTFPFVYFSETTCLRISIFLSIITCIERVFLAVHNLEVGTEHPVSKILYAFLSPYSGGLHGSEIWVPGPVRPERNLSLRDQLKIFRSSRLIPGNKKISENRSEPISIKIN